MSIEFSSFDVINGFAVAALMAALAVTLIAIRITRRQRDTIAALREDIAGQRPLVDRLPKLEEELAAANSQLQAKSEETSRLGGELETLRQSHQARLEEIGRMKEDLEEKFSTLASGALKSNSERFLELVSERFKQHKSAAEEDLTKRQTAIGELVKPLNEKLGKFDERINEIEKARNEAYGAIRTQVLELTESQKTLGRKRGVWSRRCARPRPAAAGARCSFARFSKWRE